MLRFLLRRLAFIPVALLLVNFLGFSYAQLVLPIRAARIPYLSSQVKGEPLLPAYATYLRDGFEREYEELALPGKQGTLASAIRHSSLASVGLLALALVLSVPLGVALGVRAVRVEPRRIARWLPMLSTGGLAMPSFYIGSILITAAFYYGLRRGAATLFPVSGFGWDAHLVLPVLALMIRPTAHMAQMTAGLLEAELGKRYVVTARSIGLVWRAIRSRYAFRAILASLILMVASTMRLLMADLILVEWLFQWPGLGGLFAHTLVPAQTSRALGSELFLNPPMVATLLTVFAAIFLLTDLLAAVLVRSVDPRLRETSERSGTSDVSAGQPSMRRRNWSLLLGAAIVLAVVAISVIGPSLAPRDPMERNVIVQVGDGWERPPFAMLTVPGFPLGSDQFGRDLLSWVLWAVRPTMILVGVVALVRLVLGTWIGMGAGWATGRLGHLLDAAISAALSVPALMVALAAIAAVGIEIGPLAFVVGLSVTGWAETARIVREQTRVVRGHQYIEAAQALGQSDRQVLLGHVLRQIMPMVWMLLALEISSTLMTVAGLGFLGYYIGGDVWVEISDYTAARISGMPELAQMLSTANMGVQRLAAKALPWAVVIVGTTIFLIVLGFNLLGEGLQRRLEVEGRRGRGRARLILDSAGSWLQERIGLRTGRLFGSDVRPVAAAAGLILVAGAGFIWWQAQVAPAAPQEEETTASASSAAPELISPEARWTFYVPTGASGAPAVAPDGTVFVTSKKGVLYALDGDGQVTWQAALPAAAVGSPAVGAKGEIYVADKAAGLSAFGPDGALRWRFQSDAAPLATAGPTVGPDGSIYFPLGNALQAVSAEGAARWASRVPSIYGIVPAIVDPSGEWLFWVDHILDAEDGSLVKTDLPVDVDQYLVGADGRTYFLADHNVMRWEWGEQGPEVVEQTRWDHRSLGAAAAPTTAGVSRQHVVWMFYLNFYERTRIAWMDVQGRVLSAVRLDFRAAIMAGVDGNSASYVCGHEEGGAGMAVVCLAFETGSDEASWRVELVHGEDAVGGALAPGRLYVTLVAEGGRHGWLVAIGN